MKLSDLKTGERGVIVKVMDTEDSVSVSSRWVSSRARW